MVKNLLEPKNWRKFDSKLFKETVLVAYKKFSTYEDENFIKKIIEEEEDLSCIKSAARFKWRGGENFIHGINTSKFNHSHLEIRVLLKKDEKNLNKSMIKSDIFIRRDFQKIIENLSYVAFLIFIDLEHFIIDKGKIKCIRTKNFKPLYHNVNILEIEENKNFPKCTSLECPGFLRINLDLFLNSDDEKKMAMYTCDMCGETNSSEEIIYIKFGGKSNGK